MQSQRWAEGIGSMEDWKSSHGWSLREAAAGHYILSHQTVGLHDNYCLLHQIKQATATGTLLQNSFIRNSNNRPTVNNLQIFYLIKQPIKLSLIKSRSLGNVSARNIPSNEKGWIILFLQRSQVWLIKLTLQYTQTLMEMRAPE